MQTIKQKSGMIKINDSMMILDLLLFLAFAERKVNFIKDSDDWASWMRINFGWDSNVRLDGLDDDNLGVKFVCSI